MVEHVGEEQIDVYARTLAGLLEPGGRLLNHGIARLRHTDPDAGAFSERYVFPDADPLHLSRVLLALERAGFVTRHVEELRRRLRRDPAPLGAAPRREPRRGDRASPGPERVRVWRLYLRAARNGFESGFTSIYQAALQERLGLSLTSWIAVGRPQRHRYRFASSSLGREAVG